MECDILPFVILPYCNVTDFICFSTFHHGGLGHGYGPYVLG
jgi:hypothetical protein